MFANYLGSKYFAKIQGPNILQKFRVQNFATKVQKLCKNPVTWLIFNTFKCGISMPQSKIWVFSKHLNVQISPKMKNSATSNRCTADSAHTGHTQSTYSYSYVRTYVHTQKNTVVWKG